MENTPISEIKKIVKAETKAEPTEEAETTAEPTAEETLDNAALITSAICDVRAAFTNLFDIVRESNDTDEYTAEMLRALFADIDYYKFNIL